MMRAYAAALLLVFSSAWIPPAALAQLPLPGSLIVTVTSPSQGATVKGTIPVSASVSIVGSLTVSRVDFYVDGNFIGSDSTASYSVSWDTRKVGNGSHTLTAVAQDVLGVRWTSSGVSVTVANDTTRPAVTVNQAATQADPTSTSPINFTVVFSESVSGFTAADVTISGTAGGTKTAVVSGGPSTYNVAVSGMTAGTVIATIAAGVAQDTAGNTNTESTSTDNTVTFETTAPPPGTVTRFEETDSSISYAPAESWGSLTSAEAGVALSGDIAAISRDAGATATFTFIGTGVSWLGLRCELCGIARVFLDGALVESVDTYAATRSAGVMFTTSGLASGSHTLVIELTGTSNASSGNTNVVVDAFDVTSSSPAPTATSSSETALVQEPEIDSMLAEVLQAARLDQLIEAVLTFGHFPTATDITAVAATGVQILPFKALPMLGVRGTASQILALFGIPGLQSIYYNRPLSYFLDESVPLIEADRAWNELGFTGRGVTIAVIDTGIDGTHADLRFGEKVIQNVKVGPDLFGSGPIVVEGLLNTDTTSGHGTHVASTAAGTGAALRGKYRGVAIDANLVGVGAGEALFVLTALEGFDWVLANRDKYGIRVISNSWGTTGSFSPNDPINVASKSAHDAGLVVVFAAGNEGPAPDTLNPFCVAQWVICVAAGEKDGRTLADFSSRGVFGDPLLHPTITAPGVDIAAARATTGIVVNTFFIVDLIDIGTDAVSYAVASGTSMATPHVSGTVALMLEANPLLTPDEVKSLLEATATPMPGFGVHEVGAGHLNAFEAVSRVLLMAVER